MSVVPFDHATARRELPAVAARLAALISGEADLRRQVPGLDWTAGQVVTHLVVVARIFTDGLRGEGARWADRMPAGPASALFRQRLAAMNSRAIARTGRDHPDDAAGELAGAYAALQVAADQSADEPDRESLAPWYGPEFTLPARTFLALALAESLVHGLDIARATGQRWQVPRDAARVVLGELMTGMLPSMVDPAAARGFAGRFDVAIRGGVRFVIGVADLAAEIAPAGSRPVDCHMSLAPVPALLLAYGRIPRWRAAAAGGVTAWGRRPWLAWRFPALFQRP